MGDFKILSVEQVRAIEDEANSTGFSYDQMMQNAGAAVAARVADLIKSHRFAPTGGQTRVTVLVGPGKNGGDGLVAAHRIAELPGVLVRAYLLKPRGDDDMLLTAARDAGVSVADAENDLRYRVLTQMIASSHIVLDALYGTGAKPPLRDEAAHLLRAVHKALSLDEPAPVPFVRLSVVQPAVPRPYILAVDCPSGVDCDTGNVDERTLKADETITFIAAKPGLLHAPAVEVVGQLTLTTIGLPDTPTNRRPAASLADATEARSLLPERPVSGNKGTFGTALIVGGAATYYGAPILAAQAAYRVGAGLVGVASGQQVVSTMAALIPEAVWHPLQLDSTGNWAAGATDVICKAFTSASAGAVGVGLGQSDAARTLLLDLLQSHDWRCPLVLDADALNILSAAEDGLSSLSGKPVVLTPHPGEMGRLAGLSVPDVNRDRIALAREKAAQWGVTVLLKGAHTVIASSDGDMRVLPFKNSGMATGGAGDVLTGIIAGLMAQGATPFSAAVLGGYLHGLAGEIAANLHHPRSLVATHLIHALGSAFKELDN